MSARSDNQQQLKYIASVVRALVTSRKPPCPLRDILREYLEVENKQLPYRSLGYNSAEELLRDTGEFIFNGYDNNKYIVARHNDKTAHIASFVRGQKKSKSVRLNAVKQERKPRSSSQSWNKSSYSTMSHWGDRNNNSSQQSYNRYPQQQQQKSPPKPLQYFQQKSSQSIQQKPQQPLQQKPQQSYQQITPQPVPQKTQTPKSLDSASTGYKELTVEMLEAKIPKQQGSPRPILGQKNGNTSSSPLSQAQKLQRQQQLEQQQQLQQQQQKQQQQQQQLQEERNQQQKSQQQQLESNGSSVLSLREKQRAELLATQRRQMMQQQAAHQQQQQQQQKKFMPPSLQHQKSYPPTKTPSVSVQNRLKIHLNGQVNGYSATNGSAHTNGTSHSVESSPASELAQNPLDTPQKSSQEKQEKEKSPDVESKKFEFNLKMDPIKSLSQYCDANNFQIPEYNVLKSKFSRMYQCRVKINGKIFSTYPNEYQTGHMAQIACAQLTIEQIRLQQSRQPLPPCTDSDEELVDKVYNEVLKHSNGIFSKNLPEWFESTFKQSLPDDWWSVLLTSDRFTTEPAAVGDSVIVFAKPPTDNENETLNGSNPMPTTIIIQMEPIALPWTQKYWDLYITHCVSTVEVWARLFGKEYNERFDALMNDIDIYMLTEKERPLSIACKSLYLVSIAECWHRVRVERVDKLNGTALCFFIDFGDADWVAVSKLHICEPQFLRLPAQAVLFSLFGLEDFAGNPNARRHVEALLLSKSVVGEILTKETDFYGSDASVSGKIRVVLYDTSSEDDVNLNPMLLNKICDDTPPPEIKRTGVSNIFVTHITDEGDLFVQISSTELKYVQKLIQQLIESKFNRDQHKITRDDLKRSNLFLICDESNIVKGSDRNWYRGALTDDPFDMDDDEFDILYVDHGQTQRTHISKIFRLDSLSAALSKFPRQAIKVRLHNIPEVTPDIVGRMRALLPPNCEALVKMAVFAGVPLVTVYRRLQGPDTLCTINDVIRIEHELESCSYVQDNVTVGSPVSVGVDSMIRGLTITSVPTSPQKVGGLPKLKDYEAIPAVGEFFEVRITMSANPSNFMIQPYKDYPGLRIMTKELQQFCEQNQDFIPADMVQIGQAYAAKNADGFYHRVYVVNTYNETMIHVCFCDFGDITVLRSDQLKILPANFRSLPKMALQAKLYGIAPRSGDWSLEDCLRFRQLTVGLKFVSTIKRILTDRSVSPPSRVLELELIDVQTEEDVLIHKILLKEERAVIDEESVAAAQKG